MKQSLFYPLIVGILLGWLQTGLFFQFSFSLSSGFTTYLLITLCWLAGSALGVSYVWQMRISLTSLLFVMVGVYLFMGVFLKLLPFHSEAWPIYGILILCSGLYPGVFFGRLSSAYTAQRLFLWENNGFIIGLVLSTILFMIFGRSILVWIPILITLIIAGITTRYRVFTT